MTSPDDGRDPRTDGARQDRDAKHRMPVGGFWDRFMQDPGSPRKAIAVIVAAALPTVLISAVVLVVALGAVIMIVVDLDRPREGFVQVSQQPLIDLQEQTGPP